MKYFATGGRAAASAEMDPASPGIRAAGCGRAKPCRLGLGQAIKLDCGLFLGEPSARCRKKVKICDYAGPFLGFLS
jgi:hypothetical protein